MKPIEGYSSGSTMRRNLNNMLETFKQSYTLLQKDLEITVAFAVSTFLLGSLINFMFLYSGEPNMAIPFFSCPTS